MLLILKILKDRIWYYKGIFLAKYENWDKYLYFYWDQCYFLWFNQLRFYIIQQTYDNIPEKYPGWTKTYDLITRSIDSQVYITILFDLYIIAIYVINLNLQDKSTKDNYDLCHLRKKDGKTFFLII